MKHYELYKDEELVSMYRDGDARAVDEIMERYKNLVRKKANDTLVHDSEQNPEALYIDRK